MFESGNCLSDISQGKLSNFYLFFATKVTLKKKKAYLKIPDQTEKSLRATKLSMQANAQSFLVL